MGESIIVPIFKRGLRSDYANHRDITLISIESRLLFSVIFRRLQNTREGKFVRDRLDFALDVGASTKFSLTDSFWSIVLNSKGQRSSCF